MGRLAKNALAPKFRARNQDGESRTLESYKDDILILYFYPKDATKGCTIEAHDFSARMEYFANLGAKIVGISPDSAASHQKFIAKECIKFELLCDESREIARSYDAFGIKNLYGKVSEGIIRSTFIIKDGVILEAFYNVKATNHAQKVLDSLQKILKSAK